MNKPIRVLYSFPNKLGAQRICYTAWQQVNGLAAAGAKVSVFTGGLLRPVTAGVTVHTTLVRGRLRLPYKLIGSSRAMALHDYIVSRRVKELACEVDIIHTWPQGALRTLEVAKELGIPTVLERCNTHTRFAYEVVQKECERLGVSLPPSHESAFNEDVLRVEEEEFRRADRLLCPSDFVLKTFLDRGFAPNQLARHIYGFDETLYYPSSNSRDETQGLTMLFVGVCAVRKGLHYALEAWLKSPASETGTFLIAGEFLPAYAEKLAPQLAHPSVRVLGHRKDVPELMRESDILVLPSIEEGSALVAAEGRGSGCALLVSEAAGAVCQHMENAMVHCVGDTATLAQQITTLHQDRGLLAKLRAMSLRMVPEITWTAAGVKLLDVYRQVIEEHKTREDGDRVAKRQSWNAANAVTSSPSITAHVSRRANSSIPYTQETREPAKTKYVLISPVRDEDRHIVTTLESVIGQTLRPAEWVIVDDGSNDKTGKIIDEYAKQHPWITALHRADRGRRLAGTGVMEAFHYGFELLQSQDWNFIGKLDGDVGLRPDYFEACLQRFAGNARLGICGGVMYCEENGQLKLDEQPTDHVRGALKLYRRSCWQDIGGLIRTTGWDTVDEVHANMLGWQTRSFSDLIVIHHRPTGAPAGRWHDNVKNGVADYVSGYHPLFLALKCLKRSLQKPYMLKSIAHAYGYLSAYARRMPRGANKELVHYIRSQQMRRLLLLPSNFK